MLEKNVEYEITVRFRDPYGCADETDPEFAITDALEDIDLTVVDVSSLKRKVVSDELQ